MLPIQWLPALTSPACKALLTRFVELSMNFGRDYERLSTSLREFALNAVRKNFIQQLSTLMLL